MDSMIQFQLSLGNLQDKSIASEIMLLNQKTESYGLTLTYQDALELAGTRQEALKDNGRVEMGSGILPKLIETFCSSSYIHKQNYTQTLNELLETFYYMKSECLDEITDDELLDVMKDRFEHACGGSIELLQGRELNELARSIRGCETDQDEDEENQDYETPYDYEYGLWNEEKY